MKKNQMLLTLLTGTMVIAAIVYGAIVLSKIRVQKEAEEGISLSFGDKESMERIAYIYQDESVAIVRQDGNWVLETEPKLNIDQKIPQQMCDLLGTLKATREIPAEGKSQKFGLAVPQTAIHVMVDGAEHILSIGMRNTNTKEYYVSVDNKEAAFLVDESILDGFQYGKEELYLPPEPVSLYYTYATTFSYFGEQGTLVEFERVDSVWQRKGVPTDAVNQDALLILMKQFCTMRIVESILSPGTESYGIEKPVQIVSLGNDTENVTIFFGNVDQDTEQQYIHVTGSDRVYDDCVYTVDAAVLEAFQAAAKVL